MADAAVLPRSEQQQGKVFVALAIGAVAMVPLLVSGLWPLDVRQQLVLRVASVAFLSLAALKPHHRAPRQRTRNQPLANRPVVLIWAGLAFGLASLTWLGTQTGLALRIALPSVVNGLGILAVSIVAWTIGYLVGATALSFQRVASSGLGWLLRGTGTTMRGGLLPWGLYAVGTMARLSSVFLTGRFGYVGDPRGLVATAVPYAQLLYILSLFTIFAIAVAAYRAFTPTIRGSAVTLWVLVAAEVVIGALGGGKESFVLSVLAVAHSVWSCAGKAAAAGAIGRSFSVPVGRCPIQYRVPRGGAGRIEHPSAISRARRSPESAIAEHAIAVSSHDAIEFFRRDALPNSRDGQHRHHYSADTATRSLIEARGSLSRLQLLA